MSKKKHAILRRCSVCGKFHASYLVKDPLSGKELHLCYSCWKVSHQNPHDTKPALIGDKNTNKDNFTTEKG